MPLKQLAYGRNMLILFMVILLGSLAANLISPIWPLYISSLGASMAELGYVFAISNAIAALIQIISGLLSDRYGRKKLNTIGTFLSVFPPLFYTFAKSWIDLIPWVVLAGIATGLYIPSRWSIIADYSTARKRAMTYGWMNIAFLLGSTVAPFFGGLIADIFSINVPFILCFALMGSCFAFSLLLQETRKTPRQQSVPVQKGVKTQTFLVVMLIFSALNLFQSIGMGIYGPITPIFMKDRFMADYTGIGILYAVGFGLSSMIVQIPGGKLATKYSEKKILLVTIILSAPFFGLFALSRSFVEAILLMFLSNVILNISWPAFQDLMMELTPPARWGLMNGLSSTSFWIGMMIGSAISGILWESFGMFFPYYISALMVSLSVVPAFFLKETGNRTEP